MYQEEVFPPRGSQPSQHQTIHPQPNVYIEQMPLPRAGPVRNMPAQQPSDMMPPAYSYQPPAPMQMYGTEMHRQLSGSAVAPAGSQRPPQMYRSDSYGPVRPLGGPPIHRPVYGETMRQPPTTTQSQLSAAPVPETVLPTVVEPPPTFDLTSPPMLPRHVMQTLENLDACNAFTLCRIGKELVVELVNKVLELMQNLRSVQAEFLQQQKLSEKQTKVQETLKITYFLMTKMYDVYERVRIAHSQLPEPDLDPASLIPFVEPGASKSADDTDTTKTVAEQNPAYFAAKQRHTEASQELAAKREELNALMSYLRRMHADLNLLVDGV